MEAGRHRTRAEMLVLAWGAIYATWAGLKVLLGSQPMMCERPPIADFALLASLWEFVVGVALCMRRTQRLAAIAGMATNLGLIAVAFIADAHGLPWEGCGCVFVGIEFPWLPGHVLFAAALTIPFAAIVRLGTPTVAGWKVAE